MTTTYDVLGIGNAIVDVLTQSADAFIDEQGLQKGSMTLIDEDRAHTLYRQMADVTEASGGSAGNTMAGIASLGGRGAYFGKVRNDPLGQAFADDIRKVGVRFDTPPATEGPSTARCLIFVTPDAQRTMCTYLGACVGFDTSDLDRSTIEASQITYMEGYLWDRPEAKEAFIEASRVAHGAGRKVSLTLSDAFCVGRHRESFQALIDDHIDVLFANENELLSLYETTDFDEAVGLLRGKCEIAAVTRSEKGSLILNNGDPTHIGIERVGAVVDSTGAGDLYAAGFLHGLTHGLTAVEAGQLGALCAAEVISHMGARPQGNLVELAKERSVRLSRDS